MSARPDNICILNLLGTCRQMQTVSTRLYCRRRKHLIDVPKGIDLDLER
jgi:hypothetical protein